MEDFNYTHDDRIYVPRLGTLKGTLFLVAVALMLALGLALASPAHGAPLRQTGKGNITSTATVNGKSAGGIAVELRQRTNGGGDTSLATTTTDVAGTYHFADQPSAPNDAFYYVRFSGGKGTLAAWYSFPIIYTFGSEVTVPSVELGDVELQAPAANAALPLPGTLTWKARKMGETYRVFVYEAGKTDKALLDSGSLGTGTEFPIPEGSLTNGKYEAVVQVRDVIAGYGQSQTHFHFTVGSPASAGNATIAGGPAQSSPSNPQPASGDSQKQQPTEGSQPNQQDQAMPDLKVNLSADKTSVNSGEGMVYKLEVQNAGDGQATGVVLTDKLPAGATVDASGIQATTGRVSVDSGTIKVNVGDMAAGSKATVEIPVSVSPSAGSNLSNQASVAYKESADPVQSNAYIAQVAAPVSGPANSQPQQQPAAPAQVPAQAPAKAQPANPPASQPKSEPKSQPQAQPQTQTQAQQPQTHAVAPSAPKSQPASGAQAKPATAPAKKPAAAVPQTGGSFPIVLATILVLITLLARYLRGMTFRRT
ncbi:MAG: DUF11 domain-containing protein [Chloroflexia bacterium]